MAARSRRRAGSWPTAATVVSTSCSPWSSSNRIPRDGTWRCHRKRRARGEHALARLRQLAHPRSSPTRPLPLSDSGGSGIPSQLADRPWARRFVLLLDAVRRSGFAPRPQQPDQDRSTGPAVSGRARIAPPGSGARDTPPPRSSHVTVRGMRRAEGQDRRTLPLGAQAQSVRHRSLHRRSNQLRIPTVSVARAVRIVQAGISGLRPSMNLERGGIPHPHAPWRESGSPVEESCHARGPERMEFLRR